jgi:hypothetical protein
MTERRPVYTGLPSLAEGIKQFLLCKERKNRSRIDSYVGYIFFFMKEETPRAYFRELIGVIIFFFFIYRMEVY